MLDSIPGVAREGDQGHENRFKSAAELGEDWIESSNELESGGKREKRAVSTKWAALPKIRYDQELEKSNRCSTH